MTALLSASDISVSYNGVPAVTGVSLSVEAGAIVTVIGPNGAGKSSLLNALMGLTPMRGRLTLDNRDITEDRVSARVASGLCMVAEKRELFAEMTVEDNLILGSYRRRGDRSADLKAAFAQFPRLHERRRQLAGTLSGGERQMLAIARALMARPRLLMLDEPSLGLAPLIVREVLAYLESLRRTGVAILIVEQNARAALAIADFGYVLETGAVTLQGPAAKLAADPRLIEAYLGDGGAEST